MKSLTIGILILATASWAHAADETPDTTAATPTVEGQTCLFIGHSFFIPVSVHFERHAKAIGIADHQQHKVFDGGAKGAPGALWKSPKRTEITTILETGDIDLLGMTYYGGEDSNLEAYRQWVDLAIEHNPKTTFFIGLTWPKGGSRRDLADFTAGNAKSEATLTPIVASLRELYPDNRFIFLNYGPAAIELKRRLEADELPDVTTIEHKKQGLFKDETGHAGTMLKDLSALLWLSAIYGTDLTATPVPLDYTTDLNALAVGILAEQNAATE